MILLLYQLSYAATKVSCREDGRDTLGTVVRKVNRRRGRRRAERGCANGGGERAAMPRRAANPA